MAYRLSHYEEALIADSIHTDVSLVYIQNDEVHIIYGTNEAILDKDEINQLILALEDEYTKHATMGTLRLLSLWIKCYSIIAYSEDEQYDIYTGSSANAALIVFSTLSISEKWLVKKDVYNSIKDTASNKNMSICLELLAQMMDDSVTGLREWAEAEKKEQSFLIRMENDRKTKEERRFVVEVMDYILNEPMLS